MPIYFIGQPHIFSEINRLVEVISGGESLNILLKAQSGYGKTTMGNAIVGKIQEKTKANAAYYSPDKKGEIVIDLSAKVHFIDEVHKLKKPELVYPFLDCKKYIFILATNKFGGLEEALGNRCISLIFKDYSDVELSSITKYYLKINVSDSTIKLIIQSANGVPREINKFCERLNYYFTANQTPSDDDVKKCFMEVFSIQNGLNPLHRRYLDFLKKVKIASVSTISYGIKIDKEIIMREIEPELISKGLILLTSKGRKIVE